MEAHSRPRLDESLHLRHVLHRPHVTVSRQIELRLCYSPERALHVRGCVEQRSPQHCASLPIKPPVATTPLRGGRVVLKWHLERNGQAVEALPHLLRAYTDQG